MIRRRLHRQIYFTVFACLVLAAIFSAIFFAIVGEVGGSRRNYNDVFDVLTKLTLATMPDAGLPRAEQADAIEKLGRTLRVPIALYDAGGGLIGSAGPPMRRPVFSEYDRDEDDEGEFQKAGGRNGWIIRLPDGRFFHANPKGFPDRPPLLGVLLWLAVVTSAIALGAWPFVKKLTGRLDRLKSGVERIGEGELSTRVEVEGKDEIAALATSFNRAAGRIEKLVNANRQLLAHASHELRTPLARVRLGVEMLREKEDPARRAALEADIAELDTLIDEILTMSRLDTGSAPDMSVDVDLLALAAEECARYGDCELDGEPVSIKGNAKLLRRMLRNLIDNAHKHGKPPVSVSITTDDNTVRIGISDGGDGIPVEQRERVFEPFSRGADRQNIAGYGLGLALVAQIARLHGGTVSIADDVRSRMDVSLPLNPAV